MNCEICGASEENLISTDVEGAVMGLCKECSKYGKTVKNNPAVKVSTGSDIYEPVLREDFADIIKEGADNLGVSPEEIADRIKCSPVDIKKIMNGQIMPSEEIAKKLEKVFNVKLYYNYESKNVNAVIQENGLSFGDIVDIKKKT